MDYGVEWKRVQARPNDGVKIDNMNLQGALVAFEALQRKSTRPLRNMFNATEWRAFGIQDLRQDHYVNVGHTIYIPVGRRDTTINATFISRVFLEAARLHPPASPRAAWILSHGECQRAAGASPLLNLHSIQICRNDTFGVIAATFDDADERSLLVRVHGSTVQTHLFDRVTQTRASEFARGHTSSSSGATVTPRTQHAPDAIGIASFALRTTWIAPFRLCHHVDHTFHVRLIARMTEAAIFCPIHHKPEALLLDQFAMEHKPTRDAALGETRRCLETSWHPKNSSQHVNEELARIDLRQPGSEIQNPYKYNELVHGDGAVNSPSEWWTSGSKALPVCFVGDSVIRSVVNQLVSTMRVPGVVPCDPGVAQRQRQACNASNMVYIGQHFPRGANAALACLALGGNNSTALSELGCKLEPEAYKCRTLLMNYGNWAAASTHLDEAPNGRIGPMGLDAYDSFVSVSMDHLALLRARGIRTGWLATQPIALNDGKCQNVNERREEFRYSMEARNATNCGGRPKWPFYSQTACADRKMAEYRFPHILSAYNLLAKKHALRAGVEYVDIWQPVLDLIESPPDGIHYTRAPVAPRTARLVWNWLADMTQHGQHSHEHSHEHSISKRL